MCSAGESRSDTAQTPRSSRTDVVRLNNLPRAPAQKRRTTTAICGALRSSAERQSPNSGARPSDMARTRASRAAASTMARSTSPSPPQSTDTRSTTAPIDSSASPSPASKTFTAESVPGARTRYVPCTARISGSYSPSGSMITASTPRAAASSTSAPRAKLFPCPDVASTAMFALACRDVSNGATRTGDRERSACPSRYPPGSAHPAATQGAQVAAAPDSTSFTAPRASTASGSEVTKAARWRKCAGSHPVSAL